MKIVDHREKSDNRVLAGSLAIGDWLETAEGKICKYDGRDRYSNNMVLPAAGGNVVLLCPNELVTPLRAHVELHIDGEGRA